jgi:diaminohydroxyphosphoribosylaminopyrimidine deaminase / 5-amino-6-(5-phosphoribosylamino)uracil reductase
MVEGGAFLLESLLESGLWDEALVFKSKCKSLGDGIKAPVIFTEELSETQNLGPDQLLHIIKH